jgi:hypothetical protein
MFRALCSSCFGLIASEIYSHCVPFSRCMRYSTSTSFVRGMTQSCCCLLAHYKSK